jgi:diguanylate cyclase (GGDEF)-like protein
LIARDGAGPPPGAPILDVAGLAADPELLSGLLRGLGETQAGLCLCDAGDNVRFANATFHDAFFPALDTGGPINFADAIVAAISTGQGIRLVSMSPEEFARHIKDRRGSSEATRAFSVDTHDGRWWWICDYKLANGWILVVANEMSALKREETLLRAAHATAVRAAQTDFLTGIANRRGGFERAEAALRGHCELARTVTLAVLDIDHFKAINDRCGHEVGDRVLVHFAAWVSAGLRRHDQLSRIGGEEFLVVLPDTDATGAERIIGRLLADLPPLVTAAGTAPIRITASAGLAVAAPHESLDNLLVRADGALYAAKLGGRDRIVRSA